MFSRRYSKHMLGVLVGGVALATWGLLGIFGTASAVAGGGGGNPPPPPADPAIAFSRLNGTSNQLVVCNADGTNLTAIVAMPLNQGADAVSWSPDGHSIAFEPHGNGLWRIDVSVVNGVPVGSNLVEISTLHIITGVDWSPAGDQILYPWHSGLWVMPATGGTATELWHNPTGHMVNFPRWSPTGDRIAFVDTGTPNYSVFVLDIASGTTRLIDQHPAVVSLDWGNVSDTLAYTDGNHNVFTADAGTAVVTALGLQALTYAVSFSPDDTQLAVMPSTTSRLAIYTLSTKTLTLLAHRR